MNRTHLRAKSAAVAKKLLLSVIVWAIGIMMIVPFLWMLSTSFKKMNDVFTFPIQWIPSEISRKGYTALMRAKVPVYVFYLNSPKVAIMSMIGTFFACSMAGFAYAKIKFRGRNTLFMIKLMTTMIPGMVTLLPTYMIYSALGLRNTLASLWISNFFGGTFGVFLMRQGFLSLPDSLIEAARIDGASLPRIYWSVAMPNVKSSLSTCLFMYFLWSWNDYEKPLLYIWESTKQTLPLAVKLFADGEAQNYPAIMAANVLMLLPILLLFIFCQKFFVASLTSSGLKE